MSSPLFTGSFVEEYRRGHTGMKEERTDLLLCLQPLCGVRILEAQLWTCRLCGGSL